MKKELFITICTLGFLLVFLAGFGLGTTNGVNVNIGAQIDVNSDSIIDSGSVATTAAAAVVTTAAETTVAIETTAAAEQTTLANASEGTQDDTSVDVTDAVVEEEVETSSLPSTTAEIAQRYNELINNLKTVDYVEVVKDEIMPVSVTECSISFATSLVEVAMNAVLTADSWEDTFTNGVSSSGRTLSGSISPYDRECALVAEALESASCTANADGGYTIDLQFVYETSTYDGVSNTPETTYHQTALDPINLATMEIPAAEILNAEMNYTGATVKLVVDADGNVTSLYINLPLGGSGVGKLSVFEPTVGIDGYTETTFTFTY